MLLDEYHCDFDYGHIYIVADDYHNRFDRNVSSLSRQRMQQIKTLTV